MPDGGGQHTSPTGCAQRNRRDFTRQQGRLYFKVIENMAPFLPANRAGGFELGECSNCGAPRPVPCAPSAIWWKRFRPRPRAVELAMKKGGADDEQSVRLRREVLLLDLKQRRY